jgi:hypothetical protein
MSELNPKKSKNPKEIASSNLESNPVLYHN